MQNVLVVALEQPSLTVLVLSLVLGGPICLELRRRGVLPAKPAEGEVLERNRAIAFGIMVIGMTMFGYYRLFW